MTIYLIFSSYLPLQEQQQKYYENQVNNNGDGYNQNYRENKREINTFASSKIKIGHLKFFFLLI